MPPTRTPVDKLPLQSQVFLILLALADGDAHGYRLRQAVIERSDGQIRLDPGSLYRLIARLEGEGLVAESDAPASAEKHDERRRYYTLTKRGRAALVAETDRLAHLVTLSRATTGAKRAKHA